MKLAEFQSFLQKEKIGAALFITTEHKEDTTIRYFTQTAINSGVLIIPAKDKPLLLISGFEYERIKTIAPFATQKTDLLIDSIVQKMKGFRKIGIHGNVLSTNEQQILKTKLPQTNLVDVSEEIARLRFQKTPTELKNIAQSCAIACTIMNDCIALLTKFTTENEVAKHLIKKTIDSGCELAFPPIVASGPNAATPHHVPNGKLHNGFCVIDFGVRYKGYCSDITRTIFLGKPTMRNREHYEKVLNVQKQALQRLKSGNEYDAIEEQARKEFGNEQKFFVHGLGHSVGLWVHDIIPKIAKTHTMIKSGMVWTVEPGLYVSKKWGIRIEDTVLITTKGHKVLTKKTPKDFCAITRHNA